MVSPTVQQMEQPREQQTVQPWGQSWEYPMARRLGAQSVWQTGQHWGQPKGSPKELLSEP
jgi:hypothetical protein